MSRSEASERSLGQLALSPSSAGQLAPLVRRSKRPFALALTALWPNLLALLGCAPIALMARFAIVTFGCQMNEHDSARMSELLSAAGHCFEPSPEHADVVVLNTCSVREKAAQKLRSEVGRLGMKKRERPDLLIVVAGCLGQQEGKKLLASAPEIDLVVGPDNIDALPALLADLELGGPRRSLTEFDLEAPRFLAARPLSGNVLPSTYVTVMKGCDERCSFCIVPYTRGLERYRPAREILSEMQRLVAAGVKEVTLLGQTVNSYRDPEASLPKAPYVGESSWQHTTRTATTADESEFAALLWEIAARVPGLRRLRYASPHPRHLTRALIEAHRAIPVLVKHLHLPVQSGSNRVLRRMIRRYTREEYVERVEALRNAVPTLTLSTDVIVGFPGETPEQFSETLELVAGLGYTGLFGFKYSQRPFTPALNLDDDVPEGEKSERLEALFALHDPQRQAHLENLIGSEQLVLVEGQKDDGAYSGRTERNEIVHLGAKANIVGEIVRVRVARAFKNSLAGELLDDALRVPAAELPRLARHTVDGMLSKPDGSHGAHEKRQLPVI